MSHPTHDRAIRVLQRERKLVTGAMTDHTRNVESAAYPDHASQHRQMARDCQVTLDDLNHSIKTLRKDR